jgi:hypothetical protein
MKGRKKRRRRRKGRTKRRRRLRFLVRLQLVWSNPDSFCQNQNAPQNPEPLDSF